MLNCTTGFKRHLFKFGKVDFLTVSISKKKQSLYIILPKIDLKFENGFSSSVQVNFYSLI